MPPSHPGPHPCLPERRQPAGPQATRGAARRGPSPSAGPSRPRAPAFGSLFALWGQRECGGQRRFTPSPSYRPPPHLNTGVTGQGSVWVRLVGGPWHTVGAQYMSLGGRMPPTSPRALAVSYLWGSPRSATRWTPPWEVCSQHCPCLFSPGGHGFILRGIQVPLNIFMCRFIELF